MRRKVISISAGRGSFSLPDLPEVVEQLTEPFISSSARRTIDERLAIAASDEFLHASYLDTDDKPTMIIQHVASGLRARFVVMEPGIGSVYAKPYLIHSIDPNPDVPQNWKTYAGLGIGELIYREAHRLMPEVRWRSGAMTDYSSRLREKLHAADPYVWAGQCSWCAQELDRTKILFWEKVDRDFFVNHP